MKQILLLMIIIVAMISCEAPSARSHKLSTVTEKVVILDTIPTEVVPVIRQPDNIVYYTYRVKRLSKNVIANVTIKGRYEANDTIMVKIAQFVN